MKNSCRSDIGTATIRFTWNNFQANMFHVKRGLLFAVADKNTRTVNHRAE